ncbi:hypothetical protein HOLleu_02142 [Holothuria leucospilota]|uniref:Uncharacterized protein n=1 Tax=Holothuria leucospilota TaxID=206669 RepID=A0A9Q1CR77_HOLLE|nr:hypothetical protein HOLleu_02142 [Holothuria leucospilota]
MIEEIPENLLKNNPLLQKVRLSYNNLTIMPGKIFGNDSQLIRLDLSNNSLIELPNGLLLLQKVLVTFLSCSLEGHKICCFSNAIKRHKKATLCT